MPDFLARAMFRGILAITVLAGSVACQKKSVGKGHPASKITNVAGDTSENSGSGSVLAGDFTIADQPAMPGRVPFSMGWSISANAVSYDVVLALDAKCPDSKPTYPDIAV